MKSAIPNTMGKIRLNPRVPLARHWEQLVMVLVMLEIVQADFPLEQLAAS